MTIWIGISMKLSEKMDFAVYFMVKLIIGILDSYMRNAGIIGNFFNIW